jgi:transposase
MPSATGAAFVIGPPLIATDALRELHDLLSALPSGRECDKAFAEAEVKRWLEEHPRFHIHFTPTRSSWLNRVERFFRDVTTKRIRRGVFRSVTELKDAITDYVKKHNQNPKPYLWTAQARDILEKVKRAWQALLARGYAPKKRAAPQSMERLLEATTGGWRNSLNEGAAQQ